MPPDTPRVAVVIAAYQAADYLGQTLASVAAQTFGRWECVVVDDGSTDATAELAAAAAARDARFRLVRRANGGPSAARNTGLDAVSPGVDLVAFLDSDDTWLADALATMVAALDARPDAVGVHGYAEYMDAAGRPVRPGAHVAVQDDRRRLGRVDLRAVARHEPSTFSSLVVSGTIWPPSVGLFRRAAVERAGRFDPEQRVVEDWDLFVRMSREGAFWPVPQQVAWYRRHGTNLTGREEVMAFYYARVRWKLWRSEQTSAAHRRESVRVWRRLQLRWVWWAGSAALAAARRRDRVETVAAARATAVFARQLLAGHPPAPDTEVARLVVRYVVPRSAGDGDAAAMLAG